MWTAEDGAFREINLGTFLSRFSEQREIIKLHSAKFRLSSLNIHLRIGQKIYRLSRSP